MSFGDVAGAQRDDDCAVAESSGAKTGGTPRHVIQLSEFHRQALLRIVRSRCSARFAVMQAKIVLLAADGRGTRAIARELEIKAETVIRWRERFYKRGLDGLRRLPDGRPPKSTRGNWDQTIRMIEVARILPSAKMDRPWTLLERAPPGPNQRAVAVANLLPAGHPPCFSSARTWREYMEHASAQARHSAQSPVIWLRKDKPQINGLFDFCEDCDDGHRRKMQQARRCDSGWLQRAVES